LSRLQLNKQFLSVCPSYISPLIYSCDVVVIFTPQSISIGLYVRLDTKLVGCHSQCLRVSCRTLVVVAVIYILYNKSLSNPRIHSLHVVRVFYACTQTAETK